MMKYSTLFECGPLPPYVHLASTRHHSRDRCSQALPVFCALPLLCVILNANQRTKNGGSLLLPSLVCECLGAKRHLHVLCCSEPQYTHAQISTFLHFTSLMEEKMSAIFTTFTMFLCRRRIQRLLVKLYKQVQSPLK